MTVEELFTEPFLAKAGFRLLAASTRESFLAGAQEMSEALPIRQLLGLGALSAEDLTAFARAEWARLLKGKERDVSEVKLSVLLPVLARLPSDEATALVKTIALHDRPPAAWVGALARWLYRSATVSNVDAKPALGPTITNVIVQQSDQGFSQSQYTEPHKALWRIGGLDQPKTIHA